MQLTLLKGKLHRIRVMDEETSLTWVSKVKRF